MWNSFIYGAEIINGYIEKDKEVQEVSVIIDEIQCVEHGVIDGGLIASVKIFKLQNTIKPFNMYAKLHLQENVYEVYYNFAKNALIQSDTEVYTW